MKLEKLQLPEGMQDILPGECREKRIIEEKIRGLFTSHGFSEIETPLLEYFRTVDDQVYGFDEAAVWKTFDRRGRVLALRPDSTIPAVRIAASHLKDSPLPLRLSYMQTVLSAPQENGGSLCESTQAGVELMGEGSAMADAESIALAIEAFEMAGLRDFQIDLGQVSFFKGFMEEAGLAPAKADVFRALVEEKNALAMELFLRSHQVPAAVSKRLMALPSLYGDESVLDEAWRITENKSCRGAIENLRDIISILDVYGYRKYITIDLGMVHAVNYYSGIIFRGITPHLGQALLSGGRYDGLPGTFGRPMPATGFGLSLKLLMTALSRQGKKMEEAKPHVLLGTDQQGLSIALEYAKRMRKQGKIVAMEYGASPDALMAMVRGGQGRLAAWVEKGNIVESDGVK